jgi:hypothetical protein
VEEQLLQLIINMPLLVLLLPMVELNQQNAKQDQALLLNSALIANQQEPILELELLQELQLLDLMQIVTHAQLLDQHFLVQLVHRHMLKLEEFVYYVIVTVKMDYAQLMEQENVIQIVAKLNLDLILLIIARHVLPTAQDAKLVLINVILDFVTVDLS